VRLSASVATDLRLQGRHGLILVGVGIAAFMIAALSPFEPASLRPFVPLFGFLQLTTTSFFFIAALVVFEKAEGSLEALVVTPLRAGEYLASKIATLALLACGEVVVIVAFALGAAGDIQWIPLAIGLVGLSTFYSLAGFIAVARFDSITDFLMPGAALATLLQLPALQVADFWSPALFWLWPTQPWWLLMTAGVEPLSASQWAYAVIGGALSLVAAAVWARRSFARFVVRREGDH